jgi:hypothetical protein
VLLGGMVVVLARPLDCLSRFNLMRGISLDFPRPLSLLFVRLFCWPAGFFALACWIVFGMLLSILFVEMGLFVSVFVFDFSHLRGVWVSIFELHCFARASLLDRRLIPICM